MALRSSSSAGGPEHLSVVSLGVAALLLAASFCFASSALRLGVGASVALGAARAAVQLSLLGYGAWGEGSVAALSPSSD